MHVTGPSQEAEWQMGTMWPVGKPRVEDLTLTFKSCHDMMNNL